MYDTLLSVIRYVDPIPTYGEKISWGDLSDEEKVKLWASANGGINERNVCHLLYLLRQDDTTANLFSTNLLDILPQEITYSILNIVQKGDLGRLRQVDKQTKAIVDTYRQRIIAYNTEKFNLVSKGIMSLIKMAYELGINTKAGVSLHFPTKAGYYVVVRVDIITKLLGSKEQLSLKEFEKAKENNDPLSVPQTTALLSVFYHPNDELAHSIVTQLKTDHFISWDIVTPMKDTGPSDRPGIQVYLGTLYNGNNELLLNRDTIGDIRFDMDEIEPRVVLIKLGEQRWGDMDHILYPYKTIVDALSTIATMDEYRVGSKSVYGTITLTKYEFTYDKLEKMAKKVITKTPMFGTKYQGNITNRDQAKVVDYIFRAMSKDRLNTKRSSISSSERKQAISTIDRYHNDEKKSALKKVHSNAKRSKNTDQVYYPKDILEEILSSTQKGRGIQYNIFLDEEYCDIRNYEEIHSAMMKIIGNP
jgi:hypothetical protein